VNSARRKRKLARGALFFLIAGATILVVVFFSPRRAGKDDHGNRRKKTAETGSVSVESRTEENKAAAGNESVSEAEPSREDILKEIERLKREELAAARKLLGEYPENVSCHIVLGKVYDRQGMTAQAVRCWKDALERDPLRPDAYDAMAWISLQKGEFEKAAELWRKALDLDPALPGAHNGLGRALMGLGRIQEAIKELKRDIELNPRSSLSHFLLGQQYFQLGRYEEAEKSYRAAVKTEPDNTNAYYALMQISVRLGKRGEAKKYREIFTKLKERDKRVLKDRDTSFNDLEAVRRHVDATITEVGQVYFATGKEKKAEESWQRARSLDPRNKSCRNHLAFLYRREGRIREEIRLFEEIAKADPGDAAAFLNLGTLYQKLKGRQWFEAAERAIKRAIDIAPDRSWGYRDLALLYLRRRRKLSAALENAKRAVDLERIAANYNILSWAFYSNGLKEEAIRALKNAVDLEPENPRYRLKYRRLLEGK